MEERELEGTWAVVSGLNKTYVGCIVSPEGTLDELREANRFILNPALEFITPIVPGKDGPQRLSTMLALGATVQPVPLSTVNGDIYFFEEMHPVDRAAYTKMVHDCQKSLEAMRARRAGLVAPTGPLRG